MQLILRTQFVIYPANIPVLEIPQKPTRTIATLIEIIERSKEQDRADTAILACLSMRGMAGAVQEKVRIPVIDPTLAALVMAQSIAKMKVSHSKEVYPFPPDKKRFL